MKLIVYNNEKTVTKELFVQMETLDNSSWSNYYFFKWWKNYKTLEGTKKKLKLKEKLR
jgi:hypothetical protein